MRKLKISGERVPFKYRKMAEEDAGEYDTESASITIRKDLKPQSQEHDETVVHETVHAIQHLSSLRHVGISDETWEIISGEVGRAVADNWILVPRK
jgi:hypothetical protein